MAHVAYFVAMPFDRGEAGGHVAGERRSASRPATLRVLRFMAEVAPAQLPAGAPAIRIRASSRMRSCLGVVDHGEDPCLMRVLVIWRDDRCRRHQDSLRRAARSAE